MRHRETAQDSGEEALPRPPWRAFPTVLATGFSAAEGKYRVQLDWLAAGCPGALCLALGDQLLEVPLPTGFPAAALDFQAQLAVYERPQRAQLHSTSGRTARNLELSLETAGLDVPFLLSCQGGVLLEGWTRDDEFEDPVVFSDGVAVYPRRLQGLEKEIAGGAPCRPDGRWQSIYLQRNESPPVRERVRYERADVGVIVVETFRVDVERVWGNYRCESGAWTRKDTVVDLQVQRFTRRLRAF